MALTSEQHAHGQRAIVKQVLSGDTIIVWGKPQGGPPTEKTICLANILTPRLAKRPPASAPTSATISDDEPYAWEAREFLRKKVVGKEIYYCSESSQQSLAGRDREFAWVFLGSDSSGENLVEAMVREGLANVKRVAQRSSEESVKRLFTLEEEARAAARGLHCTTDPTNAPTRHIRNIRWQLENPNAFVDAMRKLPQQINAVVEYIRDASTMRLDVPLDDGYHYQVTVLLTGVRAPTYRPPTAAAGGKDAGAAPPPAPVAEPFASEAKFFVESRLLQRDVLVRFDGVAGSSDAVLATLLHPAGNISELLVSEGFGRCADWSIQLLPRPAIETLRSSEKSAKEKRLRIWQDYKPTSLPSELADQKNFNAKVVEIGNGDWIVVKTASGEEKKIFLASTRPPRPSGQETAAQHARGAARALFDIPFMWEARELLRQRLLGKEVSVTIDYVQPSTTTGLPPRICATVLVGNANIAEVLVSHGLASVVRYKQSEENRSSQYDMLLAAENRAIQRGAGMHGQTTGASGSMRVADLLGDAQRAKQFLPHLKRAGRTTAIVEYVLSGSRLRLYLPRETCLLSFLLNGVEVPRNSFNSGDARSEPGEPFGDEAYRFTREQCLQREVQVEMDTTDRGGNFIGWLFLPPGGTVTSNLSVALLEAGLAKLHFSADRSSYSSELRNAQSVAAQAKRNIWSREQPEPIKPKQPAFNGQVDPDGKFELLAYRTRNAASTVGGGSFASLVAASGSSQPAPGAQGQAEGDSATSTTSTNERERQWEPVLVSFMDPSNGRLFVQREATGPQFETWLEAMRAELEAQPPVPSAYRPHKGERCAARFSQDKLWYRAVVERVNEAQKTASVFFLDYGNRETTSTLNLAALPNAYKNYSAEAVECSLAFLQHCKDREDEQALVSRMSELVESAQGVLISREFMFEGQLYVSVQLLRGSHTSASSSAEASEDSNVDLCRELLSEGLASVHREHASRYLRALGLGGEPGELLATVAPHLDQLMHAQQNARAAHRNLWRYGDFSAEQE